MTHESLARPSMQPYDRQLPATRRLCIRSPKCTTLCTDKLHTAGQQCMMVCVRVCICHFHLEAHSNNPCGCHQALMEHHAAAEDVKVTLQGQKCRCRTAALRHCASEASQLRGSQLMVLGCILFLLGCSGDIASAVEDVVESGDCLNAALLD